MKVVLIRSVPFTRDIRIKKEAVTLSKYYDVSVILWDRDNSIEIFNDIHDIKIKQFSLKSPTKKTTFILMPFWWLFIIFNLLKENWDYVHAADFDTFFPAVLICKLKRTPIIYDRIDFYSETALHSLKLARIIVEKVDKFFMKFADSIILPDEDRVRQIDIFNENKLHFVLNSPDIRQYKDLFFEFGFYKKKNNCLRIFFGGNVSPDRGIHLVCSVVKEHDKEFYLKVMGTADLEYKKRLNSNYAKYNNIDLHLSPVTHREIITETLKSDITIALYDPQVPNNKYSSPNKLYESMMCSKPIIVSDNTTMADIVRREKCGVVVPYGDKIKLEKVLKKLKNSPELVKKLGENGKKAYDAKYNWGIMEKRLLSIYKELGDKNVK